MDSQTIQAVFAIAGALVGVAFSTGVFVIFVKLSLKHLENKVDDNYRTLDAKLADSFVALGKQVEINRTGAYSDLGGIGAKLRDHTKETNRRHTNVCMGLLLAAP